MMRWRWPFAGFVIGMDKRDLAAAFAALEAAIVISPSSAISYIYGSVLFAFTGQAERAMEWADRALRLSPFDPLRCSAFVAMSISHYQCGRYEEAAAASRKAVQSDPGFSYCYVTLAAPLAKLGRIDEAKSAAASALALQPGFRCSHLAAMGTPPALLADLNEALRAAGLPQ
jgi:tetratricopeptide (TPR) repeat protein